MVLILVSKEHAPVRVKVYPNHSGFLLGPCSIMKRRMVAIDLPAQSVRTTNWGMAVDACKL